MRFTPQAMADLVSSDTGCTLGFDCEPLKLRIWSKVQGITKNRSGRAEFRIRLRSRGVSRVDCDSLIGQHARGGGRIWERWGAGERKRAKGKMFIRRSRGFQWVVRGVFVSVGRGSQGLSGIYGAGLLEGSWWRSPVVRQEAGEGRAQRSDVKMLKHDISIESEVSSLGWNWDYVELGRMVVSGLLVECPMCSLLLCGVHGWCLGGLSEALDCGGEVFGLGYGLGRGLKRVTMSQSSLVSKSMSSRKTEGYSKTVIGRCFNPRIQEMKSLLHMMPQICGLEGKVAGADLSLGKFQFDFDNEEDIAAVLKMEPFHFDNWMVSMVRWTPTVDPDYPSTLKFWVRVLDVPLQFWTEPTFRYIGKELSHVEEDAAAMDLQKGRVQVTINGLNPLCFETEIEFSNGEETRFKLRYERLHGFCEVCFSLCHEAAFCLQSLEKNHDRFRGFDGEEEEDIKHLSYRGAVIADRGNGEGQEGKLKGVYHESSHGEQIYKEDQRHNNGYQYGGKKPRVDGYHGEGSSRYGRYQSNVQHKDSRGRKETARLEQKQAGRQQEGIGKEQEPGPESSQPMESEGGVNGGVEKEEDPSLVLTTFSDGMQGGKNADKADSQILHHVNGSITTENGYVDKQVGISNPLMDSGLLGNDVLMGNQTMEEDDLLEDLSSSSE
ncbi:unnamed protein product [Arabidopsis arenosa]|uniref:DUF4283 domain-containing protein n=1 Tax=Arabidopsis arenosa TaxID=38785 RepID=A0A8S2AEJ4_ARAAE|nr:unnamed protein product [Arabidopsis arenosa]